MEAPPCRPDRVVEVEPVHRVEELRGAEHELLQPSPAQLTLRGRSARADRGSRMRAGDERASGARRVASQPVVI
jgi:hypothetical protein